MFWHAWRTSLRSVVACVSARLPHFRGRGRILLFLDRILTNSSDPASYKVIGKLNGASLFEFDLRPWGQKFAFYYREWEREHVDLLRRLYSGGTFIDVGSSLGLYVIGLSDKVRQYGGAILSVEPVPFNLDRQKRNVELNGVGDLVTYFAGALGSKTGMVRITTDPTMADNNAIISSDGNMEVSVVRLDDLLRSGSFGRIGMIKIDVEGYEPLVIEGGRETLRVHRPIVLAEFNRERMNINGLSIGDVWRFMTEDIGYSAYWLDARTGFLARLTVPGDKENIIFVTADVTGSRLRSNQNGISVVDIRA